ncbi:MAG: DUF433 domain-containing protein [Moorea sp. SIO3I7]|uniref:DUF433 domain-containing protein n=1 Tax=unclassified Moorena TaxID=2683338 RepID=UPI0013C1C80D|nr:MULTISPECIES: DUF433 domain-containing protein [unclassified Moorena]NEN94555.1 DUF433 domain-containing protein [Moorena sp. SIO3I7]NEO44696.1 DUF433 domain-containing protein [Moorena sp. SIO4A3]NEO66525.1 DUF433 domain-containing protein [Moorena sp. SIO4G2]NEO06281.1 DUF433 domain-containing protein [Moorena sp. SIO3I8]NEP24034.1 DUF433 domain-containing protein [Moorena sp. SIO3I6]
MTNTLDKTKPKSGLADHWQLWRWLLEIQPKEIYNLCLLAVIEKFAIWVDSLVRDPKLMGGELIFPQSRLSVRRIAGRLNRGESPEFILEDYPYLSSIDLAFAQLYMEIYQ